MSPSIVETGIHPILVVHGMPVAVSTHFDLKTKSSDQAR
jgi:hypothetical protein